MEHPPDESSQALTGLEPLRLEFKMVDTCALLRVARIYALVLLGLMGLLAAPALREREPLLLLPMLVTTVPLAGIPGWYLGRVLRFGPESVSLDGTTMTIRRRSGSRMHVNEFDLLRVRDLRVVLEPDGRQGLNTVLVGSRGRGVLPEAIVFSHGGLHWSFGGYALQNAEAAQVVDRVAAYDNQVRERFGMRLEPNVTSYDSGRTVVDLIEGWDSQVPGRFRLI